MVIDIILAAMAASNSTTTPRTQAASSSTYSAARDYLQYLALAPAYVGLLHYNNNNMTTERITILDVRCVRTVSGSPGPA